MPQKVLVTREIPDAGLHLLGDFAVIAFLEESPEHEKRLEVSEEQKEIS